MGMHGSGRMKKRGQEFPGWFVILAIILGIIMLAVIIWFSYTSGQAGKEILAGLPK